MKNQRNRILFVCILIVVFFLGFITKSVSYENKKQMTQITETEILIKSYSMSNNAIDSFENASVCYYDTANIEMLHYVLEYNDKNNLPDYYVTAFGDTIEYNKENFFKYFALFTVANNLLESRKHIINGLLITNTKENPTP